MGSVKGLVSNVGDAFKKTGINIPGLGSVLGTQGGIAGTGFRKPEYASINDGVDPFQVNETYAQNQAALGQQKALLAALKSQSGLSAQTNALGQQQALANQLSTANGLGYQTNALGQQQALNNQFAAANGVGNLSSALAQQQALANQQQGTAAQYQGLANGTGPNPAQAALNQATGKNIANQAAMMAGQRGAGANVGLMARQAAQQGAMTQQEAAGQSAQLQAQQQIAGLSGLASQQQAIGNTNQNVANIAGQQLAGQQTGINAAQQGGSNLLGQQQQQQANVSGMANNMANQQIGATTANTQAQEAQYQALQNALANQNQQKTAMQSNINSANAGLASTSMQGTQKIIGGAANAAGAAFAQGGEIQSQVYAPASRKMQSSFGNFLSEWPGSQSSPKFANGGMSESGGVIDAEKSSQKAVKSGDSYANDKIPIVVSEHEIVLPRSVTMGQDPVRDAADFVAKVLAKKRARNG